MAGTFPQHLPVTSRMTDVNQPVATALADRYRIERELGRGGMATVYLADDLKHGRRVAVKVLHPELAAALGTERFVREITIAANLNHPHILPLFDSGRTDGRADGLTDSYLYYVMPFIDGETVRQKLERATRLEVSEVVKIAAGVADALDYAHRQGVVHRDIKPENILLHEGRPIVADFGIARAVAAAGSERLTETGLAVGTPDYMSPEQALGDRNLDGRSDIYALGCVVYEMVAGRRPFEGDTAQAIVAKHVASTAPALRTIDPGIPLYLERAVARALAKEPDSRFKTAADFAEALTSGIVVAPVGRQRLAVLPPVNLTNDAQQAYLIMGLHEALISQLGCGCVAVLARTSVLQYTGTEKPVRQIGAELGVQSIVESSLFRANDTVGVQARLIDCDTEEGVWSGQFEAEVGNIFRLYRDVAGSIADEIQVVLAPEQPTLAPRAINPEAYEAYMRGRMHQELFTPPEFDVAMEYYQKALAIDPDYAAVYSGIALVWGSRVVLGVTPPLEGGPKWKEAAERAVALDPNLAEAHQALAQGHAWYDWDWQAAEREFTRAIELGPNEPQARAFYGHYLSMMTRFDEAAAQLEKALVIDPHNPFTNTLAGAVAAQGRRWQEAVGRLDPVMRSAPNPLARVVLGWSSYHLGSEAEGIAGWADYFAMLGDSEVEGALRAYDTTGDFAGSCRAAAEILAGRSQAMYVKPMNIVVLYDLAGDHDSAIEWLERSYELKDHEMAYLAVFPGFTDEFREDPRFKAMLRRMELPGGGRTDGLTDSSFRV